MIATASLFWMTAAPLAAAVLSLAVRTPDAMTRLQIANAFVIWISGAATVVGAAAGGEVSAAAWLRTDALSGFMDLILGLVGGTALIYAVGYMGERLSRRELSLARYRRFFVYLNLNLFSMLVAANVDNIAIMWIAIEGSTLSVALLVGFDQTKAALEAGWKFIILSFVGIALALFGTVLIYYTSEQLLGVGMEALRWSVLAGAAASLNPAVLKMAFIFVLIGYGTKAGVAPMHPWLPDAHAEAPTPISAVLSGLMLNLALYAVLRVKGIVDPALGMEFSGSIMLALGLFSMAIAAAFMLIQRDYKRLLAYSSIEHVGISLVGFGVGGPIGVFAALFHMLNHALAKSTAFYAAGLVLLHHETKRIDRVTGLLRAHRVVGVGLLVAAVALAGLPPFGLFISEILIATAAFPDHPWAAFLFLLLLVVAFAALMAHVFRMVLGESAAKPRGVGGRAFGLMAAALIINVAAMGATGLVIPRVLRQLFPPMVALLSGTMEAP